MRRASLAKLDANVQTQVERQRALCGLLRHPLITSRTHPHIFALVTRHAAWLKQWLWQHARWSLHVRSGLARLDKQSARPYGPPRPPTQNDGPLTRRRCVLLCLGLAALERAEQQTTLGKLADDILNLCASDAALAAAGFFLDLQRRNDRGDLVCVVRALVSLGVIHRVAGNETEYLQATGDSLYNISRPALSLLLTVQRSPASITADALDERLAKLTEQPARPDTWEAQNQQIRVDLIRRLLDDPVVYYDTLSPAQLAYVTSQRPHLVRLLQDATGLVAEARQEGLALVDERGDATDLNVPDEGTDGHLALLIAEYLAAHLRRDPRVTVGLAALHQHVARLIEQHKSHWRRDVREPGAEVSLTYRAVQALEDMSLLLRTDEGVRPLPAMARFAVKSTPAARQRAFFEAEA